MKKFIEKYRAHIGIFLVAVILIGGLVLVFERRSLAKILAGNDTGESKDEEILNRISALDERIAKVEGARNLSENQTINNTPEEEVSKININTADQKTLESLPGIGEKRASDIISYRETNGDFGDISEIKNIKGIGDSIYGQIKDQISVE